MITICREGKTVELEEGFNPRTHEYDFELGKIVELTEEEKSKWREWDERVRMQEIEASNKARRSIYIEAYRKYQSAVNYGEFERDAEVDRFVKRLRDKDWSAYESVPPQLKYFAGEVGLAESNLVSKVND